MVLSAAAAKAQGTDDGRVSVGAAAGIATPLHGDFDFTAAAWQLDLRLATGRFFASSIFFEQWQHTDEDVRTDQTISGPTGPIGAIDRITLRTVHCTRAVGWSLLGKSNGRVALSGGGGVSYLLYSREFSQTLTGCVPASLCTDSNQQFDNGAFAAQVQAGVDVAVARHVALMAQFRLLVPLEDPGSGHHNILGGVRFRF